jgi:uncharacterized protein (TIRG00374 family)
VAVAALSGPVANPTPGVKRPAFRWLRRGAVLLAMFAVLDYLVLPQIAGTKKAVSLLSSIRPWWVVIGIGLEVMSLVCYSLLTRSVISEHPPPYAWLFCTDITALGVSHLLPGGAATSTALRYRLLREGGIVATDAAIGMAVEGVGSNLVLAAITWVALISSIPFAGVHSLYVIAAIVGGILVASTVFATVLRSRHAAPDQNLARRAIRRLPAKIRPRLERALQAGSDEVRQLLADKRGLRMAAIWAAGSWALDAASLWVFLAAYGQRVNPDGLLVAYGVANLVAILPISPGGLGVIEAVMIPSLVGFGTPRAVAVLGVISWRLFNFWLPIPGAGVCYLSLREQSWRQRHREAGSEPRLVISRPGGAAVTESADLTDPPTTVAPTA